jgi:hypothetical protein
VTWGAGECVAILKNNFRPFAQSREALDGRSERVTAGKLVLNLFI